MFKSVKIKGCSASIPPDAPVKPHLAGEATKWQRSLCHYTIYVIARRSPLSVIIRLDRIIHAAEHHFPSSAASPVLTRRVWLDRGSFNLDCPIKSGNDIKGIK